MGKKFEDFTLKEIAEICRSNTDYFCNCDEDCPLNYYCSTSKRIRFLTRNKEDLEREIETGGEE